VWKDNGVMLKGEAVWSCTLMFIEMWDTFCNLENRINNHELYRSDKKFTADGLILPYGDTPLGRDRLGENIYIEILNQAKKYVYIFTPYLIISEKMNHALQMAAKRGVDVCIVTPGVPDKKLIYKLTRSYYTPLLEDGVRIFEYSPGFLHAKSFVCDDEIAVVGTINLDYRSLYLHFENAVLMYKSKAVADVRDDAIQTMDESREVHFNEKSKYAWSSLVDAFLHLFSPLL
jgi:cardiolipin synthase